MLCSPWAPSLFCFAGTEGQTPSEPKKKKKTKQNIMLMVIVLCFGGERHVGVHETSVLVTLFVCLFAQATTRTDAWHEKNACALPSFFHSPKHHAHAP